MDSLETFKTLAEGWRESVESLDGLSPDISVLFPIFIRFFDLTLEMMVSPPAPGGDSSMQKKVAPGG